MIDMENKETDIIVQSEEAVSTENDIGEENSVEDNETEIITENEGTKSDEPKKSKKASFFVGCALVMSIILCLWVISQVLSNGYISIGGFSMFRVATGSMEPEMPVGTLLISQKTDIEDIKVEDVVNFRSRDNGMLGMIITHRVIKIYEDNNGSIFLETKGDANKYADAKLVDEENLVGKVIYATGEDNFFADLISFLTSKIGFWAFIVLPCIIIGVMIMRDTIGTLREEMDAIHKELDEMSNKVKQKETEKEKKEETYEEMYERLRRELLEELNQSAEQVETEKTSDNCEQ